MHRITNWLLDKTKKKNVLNPTAAGLALSVEHLTAERKVVGSILLRPD